jgi:hypothetical protein
MMSFFQGQPKHPSGFIVMTLSYLTIQQSAIVAGVAISCIYRKRRCLKIQMKLLD